MKNLGPLTRARFAAAGTFLASLATILFTSINQTGKITAASIAAALVLGIYHEEHATERNATTAAASITPPGAPTAADAQALLGGLTGALDHLGAQPAQAPAQHPAAIPTPAVPPPG